MKDEQTICHKVTDSIEKLEVAMKTSKLDVLSLAQTLHKIRKQAQKMEDGLKGRKKIMKRAGLEAEYQTRKKKLSVPEGVNEIYREEEEEVTENKVEFEFIIKREGKLVYKQKAYAGVVCVVEKIEDINEDGQITGRTQKFTFGNPMMTWFAFDQLKLSIEARGLEIMESIKEAVKNKKFASSKLRNKIINSTNKKE